MHQGIKQLAADNWLEPDRASAIFGRIGDDGRPVPMTGEEWAVQFLAPQLDAVVPPDIRKLFEVARGCLAYGYFFYPLYTLGNEQLLRLVETAVMEKCGQIGAPAGVRTFRNGVEYLVKRGVIERADATRWGAMVELRNLSSHPKEQSVLPPGLVMATLRGIADDVNALFLPEGT